MGDIEARNGMLVRAPKPISEGISQKKKRRNFGIWIGMQGGITKDFQRGILGIKQGRILKNIRIRPQKKFQEELQRILKREITKSITDRVPKEIIGEEFLNNL